MIRNALISLLLILFTQQVTSQVNDGFVLVIHGGAGTILESSMTPEKEAAYKAGLTAALEKGFSVLKNNGSALDAVTEAVKTLEDNPLFNAGKGAVFTYAGTNEMDAAIMNGKNKAAGAVAGVTTIRNPITAARAVMEKSEHVMLTGSGAEKFAAENGCSLVDPSYFFTQHRWDDLQRVKKEDSLRKEKNRVRPMLNHPGNGLPVATTESYEYHTSRFGTVGAVALDKHGDLAAATSTGGTTNKRWGRVGDSPVIGAGTYADNNSCAVSCTGWGEYFIRAVVAKTICDQVKYAGFPLAEAAQNSLDEVAQLGGDGGLVAVDKNGNIAMPFNTEGMYRGFVKADGKVVIEIYK